jgi:hypothetical protein
MANDKRDHYLEGDRRAAMTPVLAYSVLVNASAMIPWTAPDPAAAAAGPASQGSSGAAHQPSDIAAWPRPSDQPSTNTGGNADPFLWMLSGDDDTIFFMRGVKALLRDYDPQLPYFITDSMYIGSKSPQPGVWELRCYPCHLPWGKWRRVAARRLLSRDSSRKTGSMKAADSGAPQGCGCSVEVRAPCD